MPERARSNIAFQRVAHSLTPDQGLRLDDGDQKVIMQMQMVEEETFLKACGPNVTIVCDSSPLNALLYMSDSAREDPKVKKWIAGYLALKPLFFHLSMSSFGVEDGLDPNRIHDTKTSLEIDKKVPLLIQELGISATELKGFAQERCNQALAAIGR